MAFSDNLTDYLARLRVAHAAVSEKLEGYRDQQKLVRLPETRETMTRLERTYLAAKTSLETRIAYAEALFLDGYPEIALPAVETIPAVQRDDMLAQKKTVDASLDGVTVEGEAISGSLTFEAGEQPA